MSEPALYFAEDLLQRIQKMQDDATTRLVAGNWTFEKAVDLAARHRALGECIGLVRDMVKERQGEPLRERVKRAERGL